MRISFGPRFVDPILAAGPIALASYVLQLFSQVVTGSGLHCLCVFSPEIEECRLLGGVGLQFSHLVHAAGNGLLLFALVSALGLVPLLLLPRLFLLPFCKCRSASWHMYPSSFLIAGRHSYSCRTFVVVRQATSVVRAAAAGARDNHRDYGRRRRQNAGLRPAGGPISVWPR